MSRYAEALQDKNASPVQKAKSLLNRGFAYGKHGEQEKEIVDYTAVVEMPDAPVEQKAKALVNRGFTYGQQGEAERAIADYTAVVQMPDAPAEEKANALVERGITYGRQGESEKAIVDFTAVVQMPNAPSDQKAQSLVNRGWVHFVAGRYGEAIQDCQQATSLVPDECHAHGNLAIALLVSGRTEQALVSYDGALTLATKEETDEFRKDLQEAIEKRGPLPGAEEVMRRLEAKLLAGSAPAKQRGYDHQ
jgi:tetratricopeptide (TPR) repeat protein